jgi:hypothetical protein
MKKILFLTIAAIALFGCDNESIDVGGENNAEGVEVFKEPDTKATVAQFAGYVVELQDEYDKAGLSKYKSDYLGKALESLKKAEEKFKEDAKDKESFNKKISETSAHMNEALDRVTIKGLNVTSVNFTQNQKDRLSYYKNGFTNIKTQVESYEIE